MKLSSVLQQLGGSTETKTASASQPATAEKSADVTSERLKAALAEATAPVIPAAKQASAAVSAQATPVAAVQKLAADVLSAEHEALVKEARLFGTEVCHGFMSQMAVYDAAAAKVAAEQNIKMASAAAPLQWPGQPVDSFEKFATENPTLVKEAAELGYAKTMTQMEKLAESAYTTGYDRGVEAIYKTAHQTFGRGFEDAARLLAEIGA